MVATIVDMKNVQATFLRRMEYMPSSRLVVICACFGGWGISTRGTLLLRDLENPWALRSVLKGEWYPEEPRAESMGGGMSPRSYCDHDFNSNCSDIPRDDQDLISLIQLAGSDFMSGSHCSLKIVEIPSDVSYHICEYDGYEHIAENHRTWG